MTHKITLIPGDGIGPEVIHAALDVLQAVAAKHHHTLHATHADVGWAAIDNHGHALPPITRDICNHADAILFGAVGIPDRDKTLPLHQRPERVSLLELRKGLFANLRHIVLPPGLAHRCPLKDDRLSKGIDMMIVRELTGGLYYGTPQEVTGTAPHRKAVDTLAYTEEEVRRIVKVGFELARLRRKKLASVDKHNILATSQLWREVAIEVSRNYPDVALEHLLVDNAAMQLLRRPGDFDVIVTENTFGDILSDEASMLVGTIGLVPSASLGYEYLEDLGHEPHKAGAPHTTPFYEPIHGSAPDIAGKNLANPAAAILTAAMMLQYTFHLPTEATAIHDAVFAVLNEGKVLTGDLGGKATCTDFTAAVIKKLV